MSAVDLATLARRELEEWADAAIAKQTDLGYDGPETGALVLGDPHLLHELLGNLIDNALRYGGPAGQLTLSVVAKGDEVRLCLDDEGPGIPEQERSLVLERFYRRPESPGEGCGLGLAIAKEITERHRGSLILESNPRCAGLRVRVTLPASAPMRQERPNA